MNLRIDKLKELIDKEANGNLHSFSQITGISVSMLSRVISGKRMPGLKIINALISFMKRNGIEISQYIFLD